MPTPSVETYRGMDHDLAETIAATWERRRPDIERVSAPVRDWLVEELRAQAGDTLLELAAATGDTGFQAAEAIGPTGRLYCTDFSSAMLAAGRRRGAELGIKNVDYRLIDAQRIELDDDSVDGVICRFGYMLMDDPAAALAETRRVLRPGRRVTLAVWGAPERNPFFTAIVIGLVQHGHVPPPEPGGPGLFSMAGAERTAQMLRDAGFAEVRTEEVPVRFDVPDIDEYAALIADAGGSLAVVLRALDDDEREAVKVQAGAALERFRGAGGYRIPGTVLCAVGG